ncbi:MAG TPA: hypothetical protein VNL77_13380, partial [Roseiflexaceae bacterium]|nr:hypothetical protein [Roseiflexaceae bacterium]
PPLSRPFLLAAGAIGGAMLLALAVWSAGLPSTPTSANPIRPTPDARRPLASAAVAAPTAAPTALPTAVPTTLPTAAPPTVPMAAPTALPAPTAPPTAAPPLSNAAPTALPPEQQGAPLLVDDFSGGGWADLRGGGWTVGYADGRYRIAVDAGVGTIWSYRSVIAQDVTIAVDVQAPSGAGGLVLRFLDENNYLTFVIDPTQRAYRLEQRRGGALTVLAAGLSEAIRPGGEALNRLTAQVRGDLVGVAVNGQPLAEAEAIGAPASPRFGLVAISGANPAEALFDNLQIRTVE